MDVYQFLGINKELDKVYDEETANYKIRTIVDKKVDFLVSSMKKKLETINSRLNRDITCLLNENSELKGRITEKKLEFLISELNRIEKYIISYGMIKDKKYRSKYRLVGNVSIEDNIDRRQNIREKDIYFENGTEENELNTNKKSTAYDVLNINKEENEEKQQEFYDAIIQNVIQRIENTISSEEFRDIEKIDVELFQLQNLAIASLKICTPQRREEYNCQLANENTHDNLMKLAKKGEENAKEIRFMKRYNKKNPISHKVAISGDNDCSYIEVSNIGTIEYGDAMIDNEFKVDEYRIIKGNESKKVEQTIFSNINMGKFYDDEKYAEIVINLLLNSKSELFRQYLSGYIGRIEENGMITLDLKDIAVCQRWQKYLDRCNEEKKSESETKNKLDMNDEEPNV